MCGVKSSLAWLSLVPHVGEPPGARASVTQNWAGKALPSDSVSLEEIFLFLIKSTMSGYECHIGNILGHEREPCVFVDLTLCNSVYTAKANAILPEREF